MSNFRQKRIHSRAPHHGPEPGLASQKKSKAGPQDANSSADAVYRGETVPWSGPDRQIKVPAMDETPRINWWPPIVVVGLIGIGLVYGWERSGHALGALGVIGALLLAWDGVRWLGRRRRG